MARHLAQRRTPPVEGKSLGLRIAWLHLESRVVDRASVEARTGAGLEAPERKPAAPQGPRQPERWRLARGESRSVTGFILPQLELFLPHGIAIETRFRSEIVDTHQGTALAVANGEADVATNNTTDFERFRQQFPAEAERLQVIWQSNPTPPALLVVRRDQPAALQKKLQAFLAGYGVARGPRGDAEREVLKSLHAPLGFLVQDNSVLASTAALDHQVARQRALSAQWVNAAAREARLERLEHGYQAQMAVLREPAP